MEASRVDGVKRDAEVALALLHLLLEARFLARGHVLLGTTFLLVGNFRRNSIRFHGIINSLLPQYISPLTQHALLVLGRPFFVHVRGLELLLEVFQFLRFITNTDDLPLLRVLDGLAPLELFSDGRALLDLVLLSTFSCFPSGSFFGNARLHLESQRLGRPSALRYGCFHFSGHR
jgi:hypothetical protein